MSDERPPLRLADGTLVYSDGRITGTVVSESVSDDESAPARVDGSTDPNQLVVPTRKKLRDLPESARTMNGISAVLCYTLFGLSDEDIAEAIITSVDHIERIRALPSYTAMRNDIIMNVLNAERDDVRELFVKHSRKAVNTVVASMDAKKVRDRLHAASDILDRGGFRPADVVEHRHKIDGGLTIEVIRKDSSAPVINIDVTEE